MQRLGQEEFIKILVTQMTSQDPLNPQKDTEFIAQMAQFSALENSKVMQEELSQLRSRQEFLQANSLIGRQVELATSGEERVVGTVSAVRMVEGKPELMVGEKSHALDQVLRVWQQSTATDIPQHAE